MNTNLTSVREAVAVSELQPGAVVYTNASENAQSYIVLDIGHPFILIENTKSHFATLYNAQKGRLYRESFVKPSNE